MDIDYEIGLRLPSSDMDVSEQMDIGVLASGQGYDAVITSETWGYEAFTRLGYLAGKTDTILGTGIVPLHSRSPALLAQAIGTLSQLSSHRTILGMGLSSPALIENWHGAKFESALRYERETIEIVRSILSGKEVNYNGDIFDLDFQSLRFEPPDDVSIYVAAQGETNSQLVGEFADGWMPIYIPISRISDARENVDTGAESRQRDPNEIDTALFLTTCALEDGETAKDRCRATIAFYVSAMGDYHYDAIARHGYADTAESIRESWNQGNYAEASNLIGEDLLKDVALAGSPSEVRDQLINLENKVDMLITTPATRMTSDELRSTIRILGDFI